MQSLWSAAGFADCRKEPSKWNDQWEQRLKILASVNLVQRSLPMISASTEEILTGHRNRLRALCDIQNRLTIAAALSFGRDNHESKWLKSSASYRKKHLLEGMVRTCTMMHGMEDYRMYCNEITLPFLEEDGGRGYLKLLKHFMVKDLTSASKSPIFLSSPQWDRFVMGKEECALSEKELVFKTYYDDVRNTFISHFLYNTLSSFHGHSVFPTQIVKTSTRNRLGSIFENEMGKQLGPLADSIMPLIKQDVAAARTEAKICCESCMKPGERSDFMVCGVCKQKFDRRIYYCSKKCQKVDWASRHKAICGKNMTFEGARASAVGPQPDLFPKDPVSCHLVVGPAKPGYKRLPALIHQINLINSEHTGVDYYLFPANSPEEPAAVVFQDTSIKAIFREFRANAMGSGDRKAVAAIGQLLVGQQSVFSKATVLGQLSDEFGFDVGAAVSELDKWSMQEGGGLSKIEFETQGFLRIAGVLFGKHELGRNRDNMLKSINVCDAPVARPGRASDILITMGTPRV